MANRMAIVELSEKEVEEILVAVLDRDGAAALEVPERLVTPKLDAATKSGCRPVFEMHGVEGPVVPPQVDKE